MTCVYVSVSVTVYICVRARMHVYVRAHRMTHYLTSQISVREAKRASWTERRITGSEGKDNTSTFRFLLELFWNRQREQVGLNITCVLTETVCVYVCVCYTCCVALTVGLPEHLIQKVMNLKLQ